MPFITLLVIFIITIIAAIFILKKSTPKQPVECITAEWSSTDEGWSQCSPDCSGRKNRSLKKIISGDCNSIGLEYRDCVCKISLENGDLEEDIDYSYEQVIQLMGSKNDFDIPPKLKLQTILSDNSKYVISGGDTIIQGFDSNKLLSKNMLSTINNDIGQISKIRLNYCATNCALGTDQKDMYGCYYKVLPYPPDVRGWGGCDNTATQIRSRTTLLPWVTKNCSSESRNCQIRLAPGETRSISLINLPGKLAPSGCSTRGRAGEIIPLQGEGVDKFNVGLILYNCVNYQNQDGSNWYDISGDGCDEYYRNLYCKTNGDPGINWDSNYLGTLEENGSSKEFCCGCGGGKPNQRVSINNVDITATYNTLTVSPITTTATATLFYTLVFDTGSRSLQLNITNNKTIIIIARIIIPAVEPPPNNEPLA